MKPLLKCLFLIGFFLLAIASCEESSSAGDARMQVEITDAPVDDTEIQGVFVTVTSIELDGEVYAPPGGTQTFDLLALQNGQTRIILDEEINADTYEEMVLVLDYTTDSEGNSPGCYVLKADGKDAIQAASNRLKLNFDRQLTSESENTFVLDFDLRKALRLQGNSDYTFATLVDLESSLRLVNKVEAGTIRGTCDQSVEEDQILVAYAYVEGTFNSATEIRPDGTSFSKAIASAEVRPDGSYRLDFLPPGDYEVRFAIWEDQGPDHAPELEMMLLFNSENHLEASVPVGGEVQLFAEATGLLTL